MQLSRAEIELETGIDFLGKQDYESAKKEIQKITKRYPEEGLTWLLMGDAFLLLNQLDKARVMHKKAVQLDMELWFPRMTSTLTREGTVYTILLGDRTGKTMDPNAEGKLRKSISFQRTLSMLALGLGLQVQSGITASLYSGLYRNVIETEIEEMKDAISIEPKFGIWRELAVSLELLDRHEEAIAAYASALKLDPRDRLSQRGLIRTSLFHRNGIKYALFSKNQYVVTQLEKLANVPEEKVLQARQKASEVITDIEIIQIAGNSCYVLAEYGVKKTDTS